jgi:hypothetical protein
MKPLRPHLTLAIPGLNLAGPQALTAHPDLQLLLARAKKTSAPGRDQEAALFAAFGYEGDKLPVAWAGYLGETGDQADGYCLRADPVHLVPDRDELVLAAAEGLVLKQLEADCLVSAINEHFNEEPWRLTACAPHRWYLRLPQAPGLHTHPLREALGKPIAAYMPEGEAARYWRQVTNEVQMLLHNNEVNREREAAGQLPVNGLWLWGGGGAFALAPSRWGLVWSDEPVSRGLAIQAHTPCEGLPADAHGWLQDNLVPGQQLFVLAGLEAAWSQGEAHWQEQLATLVAQWVSPLLAALRRGQIESLSLLPCNGQHFCLTRGGLSRWWRRGIALQ